MYKTLLTILFLFCGSASAQPEFSVVVTRVLDGDSADFVHCDGNTDRIRLIATDAPEIARSSKEIPQPYGNICKTTLKTLIEGKTVIIAENAKRDNFGRVLGRILLGEIDVNLAMLSTGCGWLVYPKEVPIELRAKYQSAFEYARTNKIGLFSQKRITTPAKWRKRRHFRRPKKL